MRITALIGGKKGSVLEQGSFEMKFRKIIHRINICKRISYKM